MAKKYIKPQIEVLQAASDDHLLTGGLPVGSGPEGGIPEGGYLAPEMSEIEDEE